MDKRATVLGILVVSACWLSCSRSPIHTDTDTNTNTNTNTNTDAGADDSGPVGCPCSAEGKKRCSKNIIEQCMAGQWAAVSGCSAATRCVGGRCVQVHSGCPTTNLTASYDGNISLVERYAPVQVTGCIPGGDIGRQVVYAEDKSEHRPRSLSLHWANCAAPGVNHLGLNLSQVFGVDINGKSVSYKDVPNLSAQILPGEFGEFYRQTTKVHRVATLWEDHKFVGTAVVVDWLFTIDFATSKSCPPVSKLPKAVKLQYPTCVTWKNGCACP